METTALLIFALALFIAAGSPGPSTVALVARVLVSGRSDVVPFVVAMLIGELVWLTFAIAGLAAIAERFHAAFLALKYGGAVYLLYLAWKMWTAPIVIEEQALATDSSSVVRMFLTGMAVTLGNPKIMLFYIALLPTIIDLNGITLFAWAELAAVMLIVLLTVCLTYILLASRARVLLKTPFAVRIANRLGATVMGGAAVAIATR